MDWYPRYYSLWRSKTMHLDPYQDGCYLRLIDHYMDTRQPLPDNDAALARIIGISIEQWLGNASGIVRAFFKVRKGLLFHDRCDAILAEQDARSKKQSEKSKKGAEARWRKSNELDATGIHQAMPADATGQDRTGHISPNGEIPPLIPPANGASNVRQRRKPSNFIPEDFRPDIGGIALAGELGLDAERECREFIDYWRGRGEARADWQATFRNRLRKVTEYRAEREQRQTHGRPGTRDVTGAALRVAARMQEKV
jgi:uncharacterized protein YdaU (DUF1376 family)